MAKKIEPFEFNQCVSIVESTGLHAKNLKELRKQLARVGDESIFHHTYQYFLKGHILEYTNDFAHWAGECLEERTLAERLLSIDLYSFENTKALRKEIIHIIDDYCSCFPEPRDVVPGNEFYFNETISLVFPIGINAKNLAEFLVAIEHIDEGCIYYHFYDSRVRLGEGIDDFSRWIEHTLGRKKLAERIRSIDPFIHNVDTIREHIRDEVEKDVRADMEGVMK